MPARKIPGGRCLAAFGIAARFAGAGLFVAAALGRAGTIAGTVRGVPPAHADAPGAGGDAYESRRYKYVEKIDYDHLRDFVVYIDQELPAAAPATPTLATVTTTQRDANFDPHVLPVAVGTTVRWPNEDDIFHNVFSMSDAKPFDLGYYKKEKTPEILFDRVGQVDVFCAIHSKMHCIILVVPNRFFAKADAQGRFAISDVPAGTYRVKAWHERLPAKVETVVVPASGEARVDFVLSLGDLPKY
ncbi:MAG TPA: carboxypeptidase regulatory-like domain-containing protein [Opitutaceae bacterium]|nr:carboxypeptidase regulatory-like domain-containing protein [Opitutaceae bacterium]